jgi:hypothetical protein
MTANQGGQKNRNGQTTSIFFTMFSTSAWAPPSEAYVNIFPIACSTVCSHELTWLGLGI